MDIYTITTHQTLDRISRNCPRALSAFVHLLCKAKEDGKVILSRKDITNDLSESFVKFRNDLRALAREDLLEWHEIDECLHVTLCLPDNFND